MPGKTAIKLKKKAKLRHNEYYNMQEILMRYTTVVVIIKCSKT